MRKRTRKQYRQGDILIEDVDQLPADAKPQTRLRLFLNPKKGEPYAHHKIPGTDFYVLTHSATPEKVEDLQRALRLIGLEPTKFRIFRKH